MSRKRQRKKKRQSQRPSGNPAGAKKPARRKLPDPRTITSRIASSNDPKLATADLLTVVSMVELDDGRTIGWYPPQAVAFSLVEAKQLCERAVPRRERIIQNLKPSIDTVNNQLTGYRPQSTDEMFSVFTDLWSAVLHSFAAVEALTNNAVEVLPDNATVTIRNRVLNRDEMVNRLGTEEKLKKAVPLNLNCERIAGTATWTKFLELKGIRDALVHVKRQNVISQPETITAYDRLVLGEADHCSKDAFDIVQAVWPGFLSTDVVEALTTPGKSW